MRYLQANMSQDTTSAATSSNKEDATLELSAEQSARVCKHMNDDHAVSVYMMARRVVGPSLPAGWKLTDAKMKKVTAEGCHLQAITCSGDLCEMKAVVFPFVPILTSAAQVKPKLVAIHHQVLSPQWQWIYQKPLALKLMVSFAMLGYGTLVVGHEGMTAYLDQTNLIKRFYSHTNVIAIAIQFVFYVTTVAHIAEASFAAYTCRKAFKLNWNGTMQWIVMVFIVGFPILNEMTTLRQFQEQKQKEALEHESSKKQS